MPRNDTQWMYYGVPVQVRNNFDDVRYARFWCMSKKGKAVIVVWRKDHRGVYRPSPMYVDPNLLLIAGIAHDPPPMPPWAAPHEGTPDHVLRQAQRDPQIIFVDVGLENNTRPLFLRNQ